MEDVRQTIESLLDRHERGALDRTQLVEGLAALARTATPAAAEELADGLRAVSVNHIAISVGDLERSKRWYRDLFHLRVLQESDRVALLGFGRSLLVLRPSPVPGVIPHFMFGVARYDAAALETRLRSFGLDPRKDLDSFHVTDPDGLDVQVGDKDLGLDPDIKIE
jgi:catechol 2,3-dioxygenase-like lactoylglutathione lyase family enzyme